MKCEKRKIFIATGIMLLLLGINFGYAKGPFIKSVPFGLAEGGGRCSNVSDNPKYPENLTADEVLWLSERMPMADTGSGKTPESAETQKIINLSKQDTQVKFEFHVVEEGENAQDIARKYGLTVEELEKWNNLKMPLKPGRILAIDSRYFKPESAPKKEEKPTVAQAAGDNLSYHVVLPNETVYHISHLYNMSVQQLMDLNKLSSLTIYVGQKLKVKNTGR